MSWPSTKPVSDRLCRARAQLGTFVEIAVGAASGAEQAIEAAFRSIAEVEALMSPHRSDSDIARLNRDAAVSVVTVHPWTYRVLEAAQEIHRLSAGAFDAAAVAGRMPVPTPGGDGIELMPGGRVGFTRPGTRVDLGGIAKGFAVDRAIDTLRAQGVTSGLVNAGGDLAVFGGKGHPVGIRDPRQPSRILCQVVVRDHALASSGRCFDPVAAGGAASTAVIDPQRGKAVDGVHGATVSAPSCMVADALTKVVMIRGEEALPVLRQYRASAIFATADGVHVTDDWREEVRFAS